MELIMWIIVWTVVGLACIALIPVLVVGIWWTVMTVILGLSDGIIWVVDRRWRTAALRKVENIPGNSYENPPELASRFDDRQELHHPIRSPSSSANLASAAEPVS